MVIKRVTSSIPDGEHLAVSGVARTSPVAFSAQRFAELDGMRGIAILLVLLCHYGAQQIRPPRGSILWLSGIVMELGWVGVDLFFVLSGFLIGGILIDNRNSTRFFQTFYVRRTCRIFPLYYVWLGITVALLLLEADLPEHLHKLMRPDLPLWSYLTYTQNMLLPKFGEFGNPWFGVTWSLAVEEQFYLLFPLLIRFCPPARLPFCLLTLALSASFWRMLAWQTLPAQGLAGYVLLPCRWDSLFLGAAAAWLARRPGFVERFRQEERTVLMIGGLILAVIAGLRLTRQGDLRSFGMHLVGYPLLAVFFSGLVLLAMYSSSQWIKAFFRNSILCKVGVISYGVYLLHQPVSWFVHALLWRQDPRMTSVPTAMTTLLALATTLSLAFLSWRYFESKCVGWGRKFTY